MTKQIYLTFLFLFAGVISCAHQPDREPDLLRHRFEMYSNAVNNKNFSRKQESKYFSRKLWTSIQENREKIKSNDNVFSKILMNFPHEVGKVANSKELIKDNSGCLMVMGINTKNVPTDYYITFVKEGGAWVFDEINVKYYFDGTKRFLKEAICDEDRQNALWLEYMHMTVKDHQQGSTDPSNRN